jgi:hypothetical protein
VIHGDLDTVIQYAPGRELFDRSPNPRSSCRSWAFDQVELGFTRFTPRVVHGIERVLAFSPPTSSARWLPIGPPHALRTPLDTLRIVRVELKKGR